MKIKIIVALSILIAFLSFTGLVSSDSFILCQDIIELDGYLRYIKSDCNILNVTNSYNLNASTDYLSVGYIKAKYGYTTLDSEILVKYLVSNKIVPLADIPLSIKELL